MWIEGLNSPQQVHVLFEIRVPCDSRMLSQEENIIRAANFFQENFHYNKDSLATTSKHKTKDCRLIFQTI